MLSFEVDTHRLLHILPRLHNRWRDLRFMESFCVGVTPFLSTEAENRTYIKKSQEAFKDVVQMDG